MIRQRKGRRFISLVLIMVEEEEEEKGSSCAH